MYEKLVLGGGGVGLWPETGKEVGPFPGVGWDCRGDWGARTPAPR